jgi:hypothetical protein
VRLKNEPSRPKWEALGREAVMRGVSRLEIANNMRVGRTFVRCVQIENALMIEDDEIGIGKDVFVPDEKLHFPKE